MVDILSKISTLRRAKAKAVVMFSNPDIVTWIKEKKIPKGDVLEFARAATLFAVKKTYETIPDCHPLPIEYTQVSYELNTDRITIFVEVATIYKTGVEVEAMHGASVGALTLYDMLKPLDKSIEIHSIALVDKKGGKSDFKDKYYKQLKAQVVVCSDTIAAGKKIDAAGLKIIEQLKQHDIEDIAYSIIPDEQVSIEEKIQLAVNEQYDLLIFTGGTGLSPRDITPDTVSKFIEREIPGIMEAARQYGQMRTPYAMLSRGVAGFVSQTLVLTLPGSTRGAEESMRALFPYLKHLFVVAKGERHD